MEREEKVNSSVHSCLSLTPNSTGPLILANLTCPLTSFLLLEFHLLPLNSILSNAPFPTALLASLASNIQDFKLFVTASLIDDRVSGKEESI